MDESRGGVEATRQPLLARREPEPETDVRLAGAAVADRDDVLPAGYILRAGELQHEGPARQPAGPFPLLAAPCWRRPSVAAGWPLVRGTSVFGIRPRIMERNLTGINDAGLLLCFGFG